MPEIASPNSNTTRDGTSETGLDMLYIDYAVDEAYWNEQEKELRP